MRFTDMIKPKLANMINGLWLAGFASVFLSGCGGSTSEETSTVPVEASEQVGVGAVDNNDEEAATGRDTFQFTDPTSGQIFTGIIEAESTDLLAQGSTDITLEFSDASGALVSPQGTYQITSTCITAQRASIDDTTEENSNTITFSYTADGCAGKEELNLSGEWEAGVNYSGIIALTIAKETVGNIQWVSTEPPKIDIVGSGGVETSTITFIVLSPDGEPVEGETITFDFGDAAGGANLTTTSAVSDESGLVKAQVSAGTTPGTVKIFANHPAGFEAPSQQLVVGTGIAVDKNFNMVADVYNPNAFNYLGGQEVNITVQVTDSAGNYVANGTQVSFRSIENGVIDPACETDQGTCTVTWRPDGSGDPADGRIQIFASLKGKERFKDVNSNYLFDVGDEFDPDQFDLPEAYIDTNENGQYDVTLNEEFFDDNSNQIRDTGDGLWNGPNCKNPGYCSNNQFITLGKSLTIYMASDRNPTVCADTSSDSFFTSVSGVEVGPKGVISRGGLFLSDGNSNALNPNNVVCQTGNALPAGTEISFSVNKGSLQGKTSWTILSTQTNPASGSYGFTYEAPEEAGSAILELNVKTITPGGGEISTTLRSWGITIVEAAEGE